MRLAKAILLRLLFGGFSLLFISFVTFVAGALSPGDPATILGGEKASLATIQQIRHNLMLDRPWPEQYWRYLTHTAQGDFGVSYYSTHEPVRDILARTIPMTLKMATEAIILASALGIFFGALAAVYEKRGIIPSTKLGRAIHKCLAASWALGILELCTGNLHWAIPTMCATIPLTILTFVYFTDESILTLSTLGVTTPNFVLAPILVYIFVQKLDRLPLTWQIPLSAPEYMYFILPVTILAARPAALITRLTRASMIDTLDQEFIRTAVAKGVPRGRLLFRHALRNAILPVITAIGTSFGFLLTGSFVLERYFLMPGLGSTVIEAIQQIDMPVVQAGVLVTGAMFIVLNLGVDMLLPILDPRIRESQI